MQIAVTFRHMEVDEGVKDYVKGKVRKLEKFIESPGEAHIVLSAEKFRHIAEMSVIRDGVSLNSQGKDSDLYAAIDQMVEKMERRIRDRRKKGIRKRTNATPSKTLLQEEPAGEEGREETEIASIRRRRTIAKPMSLEEAVAQLRLSKRDFLIFINSDSGQMNALYRSEGEGYEWVEPYPK